MTAQALLSLAIIGNQLSKEIIIFIMFSYVVDIIINQPDIRFQSLLQLLFEVPKSSE